jgi:hypothetical protein
MGQQYREGRLALTGFVNEVDVGTADRRLELVEAVEEGLLLSPVVASLPIADKVPQILQTRAETPWRARRFVGPLGIHQASAKVADLGLRNRDLEWARRLAVPPKSFVNLDFNHFSAPRSS